jgi:copper chaperone
MRKVELIQNLKCNGCANTISTELNNLDGISNTTVDIESNSVSFDYELEDQVERVESKLSSLGYPIDKDPNSLLKKAKSYLSCAVGRLGDKKD